MVLYNQMTDFDSQLNDKNENIIQVICVKVQLEFNHTIFLDIHVNYHHVNRLLKKRPTS